MPLQGVLIVFIINLGKEIMPLQGVLIVFIITLG